MPKCHRQIRHSALDTLKEQVLEANLELVRRGLVLYTFGNASGIDRERGLVVIKPSGVAYAALTPADMVVTDLDGKIVDGSFARLLTWRRICYFIESFPASAAWSIPTRNMPRRGPRQGARFRPTEPPTPIISTARFR